jgi:thiol-disulfide isomerase/thioredoxin
MLRNKVFILSALFVLCSTGMLQAQMAGNTKNDSVNLKTASDEQTEARRIKYLKGLRKISSDKELQYADSVTEEKGFSEFDIRYLSQDYQKMHYNEFRYLVEFGENKWAADNYVDSNFVITAKVVRPSTKEDQEKSLEKLRKLINSQSQTPESLEREKMIAGQLGKPAPLFSVVDVDSVKYDLRELKGKVVVLNFWFIGCAPCQKEMPELNKMVEKYKSKDVVFLAFEVNDNSPAKIKALANGRFNYTQIPSKRGDVESKYKVKIYPTSYVIDQSGVIRYGLTGYNPFKLPELDKTIEGLLMKKTAAK